MAPNKRRGARPSRVLRHAVGRCGGREEAVRRASRMRTGGCVKENGLAQRMLAHDATKCDRVAQESVTKEQNFRWHDDCLDGSVPSGPVPGKRAR